MKTSIQKAQASDIQHLAKIHQLTFIRQKDSYQ